MKYLFITLKVQDGEREHTHRILHTTTGINIHFAAERYAAGYWGYGEREENRWWFFGEITVAVENVLELTKEHYDLMNAIFMGDYQCTPIQISTNMRSHSNQPVLIGDIINNDMDVCTHGLHIIGNYADIWSEIQTNHREEGMVFVDAWETFNEDEEGKIIAKVYLPTGEITYIDPRAITNPDVQEAINELLDNNPYNM